MTTSVKIRFFLQIITNGIIFILSFISPDSETKQVEHWLIFKMVKMVYLNGHKFANFYSTETCKQKGKRPFYKLRKYH